MRSSNLTTAVHFLSPVFAAFFPSHGTEQEDASIVRVKTAKGRKISSTNWIRRQVNDQYVSLAKKEGYRSRSAYKLIEINDKFKILQRGRFVLDLGSSPGGWAQVASKNTAIIDSTEPTVVAVDIQSMEDIHNVSFVQCDIDSDHDLLNEKLSGRKFDVVLSDMAPKSCGHRQVDHANIINLCELARDIALEYLNPNGSFVTKLLHGEYEQEFKRSIMPHFSVVSYFKPKSSRKDSSEIYLVALKFKG
ncbi:Ribosomal RNA large subunit methyltransferase E [Anaplasma phagocytophilum]|nr:Ribosomal RNA large subunit methyltransferase E [Anaplasma phagocytophilum]